MGKVSHVNATTRVVFAFGLGILITAAAFLTVPEKLTSQTVRNEKTSALSNENAKLLDLTPVPLAVAQDGDSASRVSRQRKNLRYDFAKGQDLLLQDEGEIFGRVVENTTMEAFPVGMCDTILIGNIHATQPFLSKSRTSIYTENTVTVEMVLKADNVHIQLGSSVTAIVEGGALLMPNGQVLRYRVVGKATLPRLNGRYLLFLKRNKDTEDFDIIGGFRFGENEVDAIHITQDVVDVRSLTERGVIEKVKQLVAQ